MIEKEYLTIDEVARRFGIDATTVYRLVHKGKLPGFKVGGQWRFSPTMLESWVQHTQKALEETDNQLKELNVLKDEFMASVNHELRTPLTAVKEGVQLILDGVVGKINLGQQDLLETVAKNIDRLGELINSVLDLSKIEAGRLRLYRKRIKLSDLLVDFMKTYQTMTGKRILRLRADDPVPEVYADPDRIQQVFASLLSNAVKFTREDGAITFLLKEEGGQVRVGVEDDGIGIAKEDLPRLFQKFSQLGQWKERPRGTGLGLALCKELVEMHGGNIWATSVPGKGSTFWFQLPIYSTENALAESFKESLEFLKRSPRKRLGVIAMDVGSIVCAYPVHLEGIRELVRSQVHHDDAVLEVEPDRLVVLALSNGEGLRNLSERLKSFLKEHGGVEVGMAVYPDDGHEIGQLLAAATVPSSEMKRAV